MRSPAVPFLAAAAALALCGCERQGQADHDRLVQIDKRLGALETQVKAGQAPSPAPAGNTASVATPAKVDSTAYSPGAAAIVRAAPLNEKLISEVPADSVGGFIYTGGSLTLHDLSSRGVRYTGLAGVELQGWLKVTEAGRYQIGEDVTALFNGLMLVGPVCSLQVWLEGRSIGAQQARIDLKDSQGKTSLVLGADLRPGVYQLRLWTACVPATSGAGARFTVDLLAKAPSDLNLRGISGEDLLHRPK